MGEGGREHQWPGQERDDQRDGLGPGEHQKMDRLLEALCGRPVARHTSSFAVDGADVFTHVSVVRGPLEGLVGCRVVVFLEVDVAKSTADEMN